MCITLHHRTAASVINVSEFKALCFGNVCNLILNQLIAFKIQQQLLLKD